MEDVINDANAATNSNVTEKYREGKTVKPPPNPTSRQLQDIVSEFDLAEKVNTWSQIRSVTKDLSEPENGECALTTAKGNETYSAD